MKRIEIQLTDTGVWLDMMPDTKIKVVLNNQMFPDNRNRRDYSFPFALPKTASNNRALGFRGEIGNVDPNEPLSATLHQEGVQIFYGQLIIEDMGDAYNSYFLVGNGQWNSLTNDRTLQDFEYDGDTVFATSDTDVVNNYYPDVPFAFPSFYAFKFFEELRGSLPDQSWDWHTYYGVPTTGGATPPYPSPYVMYVLDKIFTELGYLKPEGTFMSDGELQKLLMMSNRHRPSDPTNWKFDAADHLPPLKVNEFLESLRAMFNIGVFFGLQDNSVSINLIEPLVQNPAADEWTEKTPRRWMKKIDKAFGTTRLRWPDTYYDQYQRVESDMTFIGRVTEQADLVGIYAPFRSVLVLNEDTMWQTSPDGWQPIDYNGQVVDVSKFTVIAPVADVASLPSLTWPDDEGKLCLVENEAWYYQAQYDAITLTGVWNRFCYDNWKHNGNVADPDIDLESKIAVPIMDTTGFTIQFDELYHVPSLKNVRAITDLYNLGDVSHMSYMCFNRGMRQQGTGSGITPQFSSDEYDFNKNVIGNYALRWNGDRGLINSFWRTTLTYFENARVYEFYPLLNLTDILGLDLTKKKHIHGLKGFIKTMEVEFPITGPSKIELVV